MKRHHEENTLSNDATDENLTNNDIKTGHPIYNQTTPPTVLSASSISIIPITSISELTSYMNQTESIQAEYQNVNFYIDSHNHGFGHLILSEQHIYWISLPQNNKLSSPFSIAIEWTRVIMHAVTSDISGFSFPCIYCQLGSDDDDFNEIRFVFPENTDLYKVFNIFSDCQSLNPDPNSSPLAPSIEWFTDPINS